MAACAGCDPNLFHDRACQRDALACCASCPVAEPCLFDALAHEEVAGCRFGVWGSTTAARRTRIATYLADRRLSVVELLAAEESWWAEHLRDLRGGPRVAA
ncbi:MAG: WhiB family transcriptional regulator [Actinomycetota bacterium]|nr:WhiB family transcriptional regulator [Actinomycetota bacterium]